MSGGGTASTVFARSRSLPVLIGIGEGGRYYAFDGLRGTMALLLVLLHAALPYMTVPRLKPFHEPTAHAGFDLLVLLLYSLVIPSFFIAAGFSAGLFCDRRGMRNMIRNRCLRILLPLVIAWLVITPLMRVANDFAEAAASSGSVEHGLLQANWQMWDGRFYHLWFLVALLMLYCVALSLRWLISHLGAPYLKDIIRRTGRLLAGPLGPAVVVVFGWLLSAILPPDDRMAGLFFAVFFWSGWMLYIHADLLPVLCLRAWAYVATGIAVLPVAVWAWRALKFAPPDDQVTLGLNITFGGAFCIVSACMTFGLLGLFLTYCNRPGAMIKYLGDASYWIYLVHFPLVRFTGGFFSTVPLPASLKFAATVAIAIPILLLSYHLCVRFTMIGILLNGVRRERHSKIAIGAELSRL